MERDVRGGPVSTGGRGSGLLGGAFSRYVRPPLIIVRFGYVCRNNTGILRPAPIARYLAHPNRPSQLSSPGLASLAALRGGRARVHEKEEVK
eukprot:COSAG05_NODE_575_length_8585_cov_4.618666_3_plen_92_part_00